MHDRMRVFVASSSEQIEAAERIAKALESPSLKPQVWREGVFTFSKTYIESLEAELDRADFAIVVMIGDDPSTVRASTVNLPRDNVIFELGLFTGRLGRERTFFLVDRESGTRIASDLSGVKAVEFAEPESSTAGSVPTLEQQAAALRQQMERQGLRYKPTPQENREREALWRFSQRVAGHWWERMRVGEDDMSTLSYVTFTVDSATAAPVIQGDAYDNKGKPLAEWKSVVCGAVLEDKPIIYYRWEGEHEETLGQKYGGGGRIVFDDQTLTTASGYFYDTNYAVLHIEATTVIKRCAFYRASEAEVETMSKPGSRKAKALIQRKLKLDGR